MGSMIKSHILSEIPISDSLCRVGTRPNASFSQNA
jgi:hypothetical protein